jgi:hypothetical protein
LGDQKASANSSLGFQKDDHQNCRRSEKAEDYDKGRQEGISKTLHEKQTTARKETITEMALYAYGTFLIGICLIGFLCFILGWAYSYISAVCSKATIDLGTNSPDIDPNVQYSVGWWFNAFWTYIAIPLFLLVLGYWVVNYLHRKGQQVYGEW